MPVVIGSLVLMVANQKHVVPLAPEAVSVRVSPAQPEAEVTVGTSGVEDSATVTEADLSQPAKLAVTVYSPPCSIVRELPDVPPVQVSVAVLGVQEAVKVLLVPLQIVEKFEVMFTDGVVFTFTAMEAVPVQPWLSVPVTL